MNYERLSERKEISWTGMKWLLVDRDRDPETHHIERGPSRNDFLDRPNDFACKQTDRDRNRKTETHWIERGISRNDFLDQHNSVTCMQTETETERLKLTG